MKRMLGFCCCGAEGCGAEGCGAEGGCADGGCCCADSCEQPSATAATPPNRLTHNFPDDFMTRYSFRESSVPPPDDASEPQMACRRIHVLGVTSGRTVAAAIIRRTQMGAAFDDLARDLGCRQTGIVAVFLAAAARIFRNATRL